MFSCWACIKFNAVFVVEDEYLSDEEMIDVVNDDEDDDDIDGKKGGRYVFWLVYMLT